MAPSAEPTATPPQLSQLLPKLAPTSARIHRHLFSQAMSIQLSERTRQLRFYYVADPYSQCKEIIGLRNDQDVFELGLSFDAGAKPLGDRQWDDFEWSARLLAWTTAHEHLLADLAELFGALLPERLGAIKTARRSDDVFWVGFELLNNSRPLYRGVLAIPSERALALAPTSAAFTPATRWQRLLMTLRPVLAGPVVAIQRLQMTSLGDVLVLGTSKQAFNAVRLEMNGCSNDAICARWTNSGLRVVAAHYDKHCQQGETYMNTSDTTDSVVELTDQSPESDNVISSVSVPIELSFEMGGITLPLAELSQLQLGYVFDLEQPVDGANVVIKANGKRVGDGELVAAGDTLGVRIQHWTEHGF